MRNDNNRATGYGYSKQWFDFVEEHPDKITPAHAALWFWLVELNNRLNWKENFGVPTDRTLAMIGTKSFNTYKKVMEDLKNWGFVKQVTKSTNQHTANIFCLIRFDSYKEGTSKFDEADKLVNPVGTSKFDEAKIKHTGLPHQNLTPQNDIDKGFEQEQTNETLFKDLVNPFNTTSLRSKADTVPAFNPPNKEELIEFFDEKGYSREAAMRAHDYYSCANWYDKNGKRVLNWKQKMITVWFKPENKKKVRQLA